MTNRGKIFFNLAIIISIVVPSVVVAIIETQYRPQSSAFTFIISDENNQKLEITSSNYYDERNIREFINTDIRIIVSGEVEEYENEYGCRFKPGTAILSYPSLFMMEIYDQAVHSFEELINCIGLENCAVYDIKIRAGYNVFNNKWTKYVQLSNMQVMGISLSTTILLFGMILVIYHISTKKICQRKLIEGKQVKKLSN